MNDPIDMTAYGLSDHFLNMAGDFETLTISRIISQNKGFYHIVAKQGEKLAEVSGRFRYNVLIPSDYPAVGDFVMADWNGNNGNAVIHQVLPRKSCFTRKAAGEARQAQVVAANIDTVCLCMSLNHDFNLRRLERYLSISWDSGAVPVIILTKSDLCDDLESRLLDVSSAAIGVEVLVTSAVEESGYDQVRSLISKGKTIAFIGSSGVGKSTLINCLLGENRLDTNELRNDDKGRHTTTHRELILLPNGGMVIDTPGMREFGIWDGSSGIDQVFGEIDEMVSQCRFRDCTHSGEPGCAIQMALEHGKLSLKRWKSYQKLKAESIYAENKKGYLAAKEQKHKDISKLIKKITNIK